MIYWLVQNLWKQLCKLIYFKAQYFKAENSCFGRICLLEFLKLETTNNNDVVQGERQS